jgi:hypothetical protein
MRKFVAIAVLTASATVFAPEATPQTAQPMALAASVPTELQSVALQAGSPMSAPVRASSVGLLSDVQRADSASWLSPSQGPEPAFAWVFALGFLGLVVMRRIRASQPF